MHLYRGTPYRIFIKVKKIVYVKCRGQICCSINEYSKWVKWVEFLSSVNLQRYQVRGCMHAHSVASNSLQPIDCSPRGSSVHGTFQARVREWAIIFYCRGPYNQGIELAFLESPALAVGFFFFFYHCSTWEAWRYQGWASSLFCISNRRTELFIY